MKFECTQIYTLYRRHFRCSHHLRCINSPMLLFASDSPAGSYYLENVVTLLYSAFYQLCCEE